MRRHTGRSYFAACVTRRYMDNDHALKLSVYFYLSKISVLFPTPAYQRFVHQVVFLLIPHKW